MWRKKKSKVIFEHPRLTLVEDVVVLPSGETTTYLKYKTRNNSVMAICINADNKVLIQKEYSYPPNETLYQFPGGKIEASEEPLEALRRELAEEAALAPLKVVSLGWYYVDNRRSAAKMHVFLVNEIAQVQQETGDPEEAITSEWLSVEQINSMIRSNEIKNFSALAAWSLFQHRSE